MQENKKYEFGLASSGITYIPLIGKVSPAVLELKHADVETDGQTRSSTYVLVEAQPRGGWIGC
jgi:hypothetical protein